MQKLKEVGRGQVEELVLCISQLVSQKQTTFQGDFWPT